MLLKQSIVGEKEKVVGKVKWNLKRLLSPRVMAWSGLVLVMPFLLLALASLYEWGWLGVLDAEIGMDIIEDRNNLLTPFFIGITELGGVPFSVLFVILISLYLLFKKKRRDLAVWYVLTIALGAGLLNQLLKFLFQRPRPTIEHLVEQGGYSFPSGHSMGSMILYGALVFLIVQLSRKRITKWIALACAAILVFLIGFSRIYLGVHFPSDVIGGYSLGAAWLTGCISLYGIWEVRQQKV